MKKLGIIIGLLTVLCSRIANASNVVLVGMMLSPQTVNACTFTVSGMSGGIGGSILSGDLLIAGVTGVPNTGSGGTNACAGTTPSENWNCSNADATSQNLQGWWRTAGSADVSATSFVLTATTGTYPSCIMLVLRGQGLSLGTVASNVGTGSVTAAAMSGMLAGAGIVFFAQDAGYPGNRNSDVLTVPGSPWVTIENYNFTSGVGAQAIAALWQTGVTSTGTATATNNQSGDTTSYVEFPLSQSATPSGTASGLPWSEVCGQFAGAPCL